MSTTYEIPLTPVPQTFSIDIKQKTYQLTFAFCDVESGFWTVSLEDNNGNSLVNGIPLITGADLLAQYRHLAFSFQLWCAVDGDPNAIPGFDNLGVSSHVYVTVP